MSTNRWSTGVEQHLDRLGDQLKRLGLAGSFVTGNVTTAGGTVGTKKPDATEVTSGEEFPESGRPDSNRRVQLGKRASPTLTSAHSTPKVGMVDTDDLPTNRAVCRPLDGESRAVSDLEDPTVRLDLE
jgi:hypothetical protein